MTGYSPTCNCGACALDKPHDPICPALVPPALVEAVLREALQALEHEPMQRLQWTREAAMDRAAARANLRDILGLNPPPSPATGPTKDSEATTPTGSAGSTSKQPALRLVAGEGLPLSSVCRRHHAPLIGGECLACEFEFPQQPKVRR